MKRRDTHRYLIAYDISDDRRREKVATAIQHFGYRIQFSVFIADCSPRRLEVLRRSLEGLCLREDSLVICDLGKSAKAADKTMIWIGQPCYESIDPVIVV